MKTTLAILLVLNVACYQRREVPRADWPVLREDREITVRTLAGEERKFNRFLFTTTGLSAWRIDSATAQRDSAFIPLDSIAVVRVSGFSKSRTLALMAVATTATFVILAQQRSGVRPQAQPLPPISCPFIYSFDGERYVFDSETYAGAVARALERTDVDELEHVREVDGKYRLRMKNERPETDYTDELTLLAVDHPRGTRAISDVDAELRLVRHEAPPLTTSRYGGDTIPSRAGWEMSFARPRGDTVALVLRIRNTPVGPFALVHTLGLLGSDIYKWYAALQAQPVTRFAVRSWIEREGYLDVQTTAGTLPRRWRSIANLPDVGAAISKSQVVLLDLTGVRDDTVHVRLESSPELWVIEHAALAEYVGTARPRTVHAASAVDESGGHVAPLLAKRDGKYLVTFDSSDVALEYSAPPPPMPGLTRTIFVRSTGHYYVDTNDQAVPRSDVVNRLMNDRAFAQRYFADAWERSGGHRLMRR